MDGEDLEDEKSTPSISTDDNGWSNQTSLAVNQFSRVQKFIKEKVYKVIGISCMHVHVILETSLHRFDTRK